MTNLDEKMVDEALSLPSNMRAILIEKLIESLNLPKRDDIDKLWAEEAEKRIADVDSGRVKPISGEQVFKEIHERLK